MRLLLTICASFTLFLLTTALLPVLLAVAVAAAAAFPKDRFVIVRLVSLVWFYLFMQQIGLLRLLFSWLRYRHSKSELCTDTYRLQRWYFGLVFGALRWSLRMQFHVEGHTAVTSDATPFVVLPRHGALIDALFPIDLLILRVPRGVLRVVMKKSLAVDPCFDIAGARAPNYFIDRASANMQHEIDNVRELAAGMKAQEGIVIFPEGTRFSQRNRTYALERLRHAKVNPDMLRRAEAFKNVLPPRPTGAWTLRETYPDYDFVFITHAGLEGVRTLYDAVSSSEKGRHVYIKMWRIKAANVPAERDAFISWLYDEWNKVDRYVGETNEHVARHGPLTGGFDISY